MKILDGLMATLAITALCVGLWQHHPTRELIWIANCLIWVGIAHFRLWESRP